MDKKSQLKKMVIIYFSFIFIVTYFAFALDLPFIGDVGGGDDKVTKELITRTGSTDIYKEGETYSFTDHLEKKYVNYNGSYELFTHVTDLREDGNSLIFDYKGESITLTPKFEVSGKKVEIPSENIQYTIENHLNKWDFHWQIKIPEVSKWDSIKGTTKVKLDISSNYDLEGISNGIKINDLILDYDNIKKECTEYIEEVTEERTECEMNEFDECVKENKVKVTFNKTTEKCFDVSKVGDSIEITKDWSDYKTGDWIDLDPSFYDNDTSWDDGTHYNTTSFNSNVTLDPNDTKQELPNNAVSNDWVDMTGNVLLYHMNDSSQAEDMSGTGNDGTVSSAPSLDTSVYILNSSIEFDGVDDHIEARDDASLDITSGGMTVALWANLDDTTLRTLATKGSVSMGTANQRDWDFICNSGEDLKVLLSSGSAYLANVGVTDGCSLGWHHYAFTWDGGDTGTVKLFIDGENKANGSKSTGTIATTFTVKVGGDRGGASYEMDGHIDEFAIWNRELTPAEMSEIYDKQKYTYAFGEGEYESRVFDATFEANWSNFTWEESVPASTTLTLQVRSCDDASCSGETFVGPDNTTSTYFTDPGNILLNETLTPNNQYLQYKAFFTTSDKDASAELQSVEIIYESIAAADVTGPTISVTPYPSVQGFGEDVDINATVTDVSGVEDVYIGITPPGGSETNYSTTNLGDVYTKSYNEYTNGTYSFTVYANDTLGNANTESGTFDLNIDIYMNVRTLKDDYQVGEDLNLTDPPEIKDAFVSPTKVVPGDIMLVQADVTDIYPIKQVTANMGDIETIELYNSKGTIWNEEWLVHDTEWRDYITTITAENIIGEITTAEVLWSDPPVQCYSCQNCTDELVAQGAGTTVQLAQDITTEISQCIPARDNQVFDCNGYTMTPDTNLKNGYAFFYSNDENFTVKNCVIEGFTWATYISGDTSDSNKFINNTFRENTLAINVQGDIEYTNFTDNTFERNSRILIEGTGDDNVNTTWYNNQFIDNQVPESITFARDNASVDPGMQVNFNFTLTYPNLTNCPLCTYNLSVYPSTPLLENLQSNRISANFTPDRNGIYSVKINVTDTDNNFIERNYVFLVNVTQENSTTFYMRGDLNATHGQPLSLTAVSEDAHILTYDPAPAGSNDIFCATWSQVSPNVLPNDLIVLFKEVNISAWYSGTAIAYGVERYSGFNDDVDYTSGDETSGAIVYRGETFSPEFWTTDRFYDWYWIAPKIHGSNPLWNANSENQSIVNFSYYFVEPRIKYISTQESKVLAVTYAGDNDKNISLVMDGSGHTNISLLMINKTATYSVKLDGSSCTGSCSYSLTSGELNITADLSGTHTFLISEATDIVISDVTPITASSAVETYTITWFANESNNKGLTFNMYYDTTQGGTANTINTSVDDAYANCDILADDTSCSYIWNVSSLDDGSVYYITIQGDDGVGTFNNNSFSTLTINGYQSKIRNDESTNISAYLLMTVDYNDGGTWRIEDVIVNDTTKRQIDVGVGNQLKLDSLFNGLWNTSNATSGNGNYRVYVALTDEVGEVLMNKDGTFVNDTYAFTISNTPPPAFTNVILNSTDIDKNDTNENLTVYWDESVDENGDSLYNITDWRVEGVSIALLNFPFDTNNSGGIGFTRDYSTNSNNVSVTTISTQLPLWNSTGGIKGGAYEYDGSNNRFDDNNSIGAINGLNNFTISLWFKAEDLEGNVSVFEEGAAYLGYWINLNDSNNLMSFGIRPSNTFYEVVNYSTDNINLNQWHYIAGTWNSTTLILYLDGVEVNRITTVTTSVTNPGDGFTIGKAAGHPLGGTYNFDGTIDELIVYNRALSPEQIALNYQEILAGRSIQVMHGNELNFGDNWTVAVTSSDLTDDGGTTLSNSIYINQANQVPTVTLLLMNSTSSAQLNRTNEDLHANFYCNDADDSDTLTYDISFYKDGVGNFSYTSVSCSDPEYVTVFLDSSNTTVGEKWSFSVNISDDHPTTSSTVYSNNVTITNEIPLFEPIDNFSLSEDFGTHNLDLSDNVSDLDNADSLLNFTWTNSNSGLVTVAINNETDVVTLTSQSNQSGTATINFTVWDLNNAQNSSQFVLTVNAVNDNPWWDAISNTTQITEDTANQNVSVGYQQYFRDVEDDLTPSSLTIISDNETDVTCAMDTGDIECSPTNNFTGFFSLRIQGDDSGGLNAQASFDVEVTNVNDAPFVEGDLLNITDDEDAGTLNNVITVTSFNNNWSDVEDANPSSYELVTSTNTSTSCYFDGSNNFDCVTNANETGTDYYTIALNDSEGASVEYRWQITINAVNDQPWADPTSDPAAVNEDSGLDDDVIAVATLNSLFRDVEEDQSPTSYSISEQSDNSIINCVLDGSNNVDCTTQANQSGTNTIKVELGDSGGLTVNLTYNIVVNAVNDEPWIEGGGIGNITISEDSTNDNLITVAQFQSNFSDVEDNNNPSAVVLSYHDNTKLTCSIDGSKNLDCDGINNNTASSVIIINMTDSGGLNTSTSFYIDITAVNDAPFFEPIDNFAKDEDFAQFTLNLTNNLSDVEDSVTTLGISYQLNQTGIITLSIDNTTNILTFDSVSNQSGIVDINLTAVDSGGLTKLINFNLTVNAVDDDSYLIAQELYPATPYTHQNLELNVTCLDIDSSTIMASWNIYKDNVNQTSLADNLTVSNDTNTLVYTIDYTNIQKNEQWWATVWCDGSIEKNTSIRTIQNTLPDDTSPFINSTDATNLTSVDLECGFTPKDNDTEASMYANITWYESNIIQLEFSSISVTQNTQKVETLKSGNLSEADEWKCGVQICDDQGCGNWVNSSTLTILDVTAPVVTLLAPENMSNWTSSSLVNFTYNVSDNANIDNCSLIVDGNLLRTESSVTKNINQTIYFLFANGTYQWSINCTDAFNNIANSLTYNLSVAVGECISIDECREYAGSCVSSGGTYGSISTVSPPLRESKIIEVVKERVIIWLPLLVLFIILMYVFNKEKVDDFAFKKKEKGYKHAKDNYKKIEKGWDEIWK